MTWRCRAIASRLPCSSTTRATWRSRCSDSSSQSRWCSRPATLLCGKSPRLGTSMWCIQSMPWSRSGSPGRQPWTETILAARSKTASLQPAARHRFGRQSSCRSTSTTSSSSTTWSLCTTSSLRTFDRAPSLASRSSLTCQSPSRAGRTRCRRTLIMCASSGSPSTPTFLSRSRSQSPCLGHQARRRPGPSAKPRWSRAHSLVSPFSSCFCDLCVHEHRSFPRARDIITATCMHI
mmetsp:Transcript_22029/g.70346  ORF Transcript_22029/g.70346 Transcript_22029/m.70346 type:complete len:235 (-) Transcript_22029:31-735(-)